VTIKQLWMWLGNGLAFCLLVGLLWQLQGLLWLVFIAFILSSVLLPSIELLERRKVPHWLAVLLPFGLLLLLLVLLVIPISVLVIEQLQQLASHLPDYWTASQNQLNLLWDNVNTIQKRIVPGSVAMVTPDLMALPSAQQLLSHSGGWALNVFNGLSGVTMAVSRWLTDALSVALLSLLMLMDRSRIVAYLLRFIPVRHHDLCVQRLHAVARGVGGFVNSQVILMLLEGAAITLGLTILQFPFALLFGVLSGLFAAIPIIGATLMMLAALAVSFVSTHGHNGQWVWILVLYLGVQSIQNNVIGPLLLSRTLGLHPLAILLAIMAGGLLGGIPGILLAIPILTCLNVLLQPVNENRVQHITLS
jgi:predicted PurR-regulated permease PerM